MNQLTAHDNKTALLIQEVKMIGFRDRKGLLKAVCVMALAAGGLHFLYAVAQSPAPIGALARAPGPDRVAKRTNVVIVMLDDVGFGTAGTFGGHVFAHTRFAVERS